ncbi:ATP-dependent Clp protease ATP-binding subunit [Candidatus Daviesbacteria bacterium]|nr:ATP-dependent Clp protease ATP-binding subunit [Candidatus Daviesbacteria bacterium]
MLLPLHLLLFWYPKAAVIFLRSLKNILLILEEDLAVGLMLRLLFVPLFHDASIVGRVLSFIFRITRVGIGIFGFLCASVVVFTISLIWFSAPLLIILLTFNILPFVPYPDLILIVYITIMLLGLAIFIYKEMHKNLKPVWKIKSEREIWNATRLSPSLVTWKKLLESSELFMYLANLELIPHNFSDENIQVDDATAKRAFELAKFYEAKYITESYFWVAMLETVAGVEDELLKINLTLDDFRGALGFLETSRNWWRKVFIWDEDFGIRHLSGINRGWLGAPTPALDAISVDLTRIVARTKSPEFQGRQEVLAEVITVLSQNKDRSVMLVGEPGAGKSALVLNLAKMIVRGDAPSALATKRLVKLEAARLLSSVRTEGELAEKIKQAFEEVEFIEDVIIFIDEIHDLGIGDAGKSFNLYALILPYLESDRFQFIATSEPKNYSKIIEKNGSFARIFHKIELPPANAQDTIKILTNRAIGQARYNKINTTFIAVKYLVEKSEELIHNRVLPDSALAIYEECLTEAVSKNADKPQVTLSLVKEVLSRVVNVPIADLESVQKELLLNLESKIHEQMIDQEEAVKKVSDTLRRASAQIREKNRPIGSFLFVGPTGVGKTELAKILAGIYFKGRDAFVRFDMSEYQTVDAINRLIGEGDNLGELTESVKNRPYCLILLDEFEKADPKILNLFLQVLDDGRLTGADGVTTDFTETIIIATSNAGSLMIADGLKSGKSIEELNPRIKEELMKIFKPELINRFDEVVPFKPLSHEDLKKIVRIKLSWLKEILKKEGYLVEFKDGVIEKLAEIGFDSMLGARPLRRVIQDTLEAKLSRKVLEGSMPKGEVVWVDESFLS